MGNIPLQNGGRFIRPIQKSGVNPNWNTAQYEHAKSIIAGFNAMGQQAGSDMTRVGKVTMLKEEKDRRDQEAQARQDDAFSISMLKLRQGESFSAVESQIHGKGYKTVEEFDADWNENFVPQLDEAHEARMGDGAIVANRSRIEKSARNYYELSREAFRQKERARVEGQIREHRKEFSAAEMSKAAEAGNIEGIRVSFDALVSAGVPFEEARTMTNSALTEVFVRTQQRAMEAYGVNSANFHIAMSKAQSQYRDEIGEHFGDMLNATNASILDAWKRGDFSVLHGGRGKASGGGTVQGGDAEIKADGDSGGGGKIGTDWNAAVKAGVAEVEAAEKASLAELRDAVAKGIIPKENAKFIEERIYEEGQTNRDRVRAKALALEQKSKKERRELVKSLIVAAGQDEGTLNEQIAVITKSGKTLKPFNDKLKWMREAKDSDYDASASRKTLLWIYANSKRYSDTADEDGSYRLAAFALARNNCTGADYAEAVAFLNGRGSTSVEQSLLNYGIGKLMHAADVDVDKLVGEKGKGFDSDPDDALEQALGAMISQVSGLVGQLHPQAFRAEIDTMAQQLKTIQNDRDRLAYMDSYYEALTAGLPSVAAQEGAQVLSKPGQEVAALVEAERKKAEEEARKANRKAEAEKAIERDNASAREILKRVNYPVIVTPGAIGNPLSL